MQYLFVLWVTDRVWEKLFTTLRIIQWSSLTSKLIESSRSRFLLLCDEKKSESFLQVVQRLKFVRDEEIHFVDQASVNDREMMDERMKQSSLIHSEADRNYRLNIDHVDHNYLLKSTNEISIRITDDHQFWNKLITLRNLLQADNKSIRILHVFDYQLQYQCESLVVFFRQIFPEYEHIEQHFMPLAPAVINKDRPTTKYDEKSLDNYLQEVMSNMVQERTSNSMEISLAIFKLQLMCRKQSATVHLRSNSDNNHDIVFLIYTGARLVSILNSFEEKSQRGFYPNRRRFGSDIGRFLTNEIDFIEDENEFLRWINLFQDRLLKFEWKEKSSRIDFQLDKIFQEWILFCRRLSPYYCKVRVLTENQEHLLDIMFARLELIERLVNGLRQTFGLLNFPLIERM